MVRLCCGTMDYERSLSLQGESDTRCCVVQRKQYGGSFEEVFCVSVYMHDSLAADSLILASDVYVVSIYRTYDL